jgi:hypothetical protein
VRLLGGFKKIEGIKHTTCLSQSKCSGNGQSSRKPFLLPSKRRNCSCLIRILPSLSFFGSQKLQGWVWWHTTVIPAIRETEVGGLQSKSRPGKITRPYLEKKKSKWSRSVAQVVECEALRSISSTATPPPQTLQDHMDDFCHSPLSTIWLGEILCSLFCPYFVVLCLIVWQIHPSASSTYTELTWPLLLRLAEVLCSYKELWQGQLMLLNYVPSDTADSSSLLGIHTL